MLTRLNSPEAGARWLREWTQGTLRSDSRAVQPGDAFIAWPGGARDGRAFVAEALAAGASTCLVEAEGIEAFGFSDARVAALAGLQAAAGSMASGFFGHPSAQLQMIAATGTNGKTSTAWWTAQCLALLGRRCGVVGTLGVGEPPRPGSGEAGHIDANGLTTPDPVLLQAALRRMVDSGHAACAMEASSIGLVKHRLAGTRLDVALFTNLTHDHLDFHGTMDAYWAAKRALFDWPGLRAAVVNLDDAHGERLAAELSDREGLTLWTYAMAQPARLQALDVHYRPCGLAFTLAEGPDRIELATGLIGEYNVANLLAVIGGLRALDVSLADAARVAAQVTPVPGRMQRIGNGRELPQVVVDYAHTPDALDKALAALRPLAAARGGKLQVVFGCGGDRDPSKRAVMGRIAAERADAVMLTSDNPRGESPESILDGIAEGLGEGACVTRQVDRRAAIAHAVTRAAATDVVLIAGKGHEDYQEINGARLPFSDVAEARAALIERAGL